MENNKNEFGFIGYEYKDINTKCELESIYKDGYRNFGWSLEKRDISQLQDMVKIRFKRDRKIRNRVELTRLQRQFEANVLEIDSLEKSKTLLAMIVSFIVGFIGCGFMAGSVFSYTGGMIVLCIIFAIPGFMGWIAPYFLYCNIKAKKEQEIGPIIEQKYDQIYDICERANRLL